ncbi:MAG: hypothetical protein AB8B74_05685 [Crocinitomicaceae bacterium]
MNKGIFIVFALTALFSCNKDQKVVRTLDGKWLASSFVVSSDQLSVDWVKAGITYKMQFTKCELKDEESCDAIITASSAGVNPEISNAEYRVYNDGTLIEFTGSGYSLLSIDYIPLSIDKLTKSALILSYDDGDIDLIITLEKQ